MNQYYSAWKYYIAMDFIITDCNFTPCGYGIMIAGVYSGKVTSVKLLNNVYGIQTLTSVTESDSSSSLQKDQICTLNNQINLFCVEVCSNLSLSNSQFDDGGDLRLAHVHKQQLMSYTVFDIQNCNCSFWFWSLNICLPNTKSWSTSNLLSIC